MRLDSARAAILAATSFFTAQAQSSQPAQLQIHAEGYDRAHPIYLYPDWPVWTGKGDPEDSATWTRSRKPVRTSD